MAFTTFIDDLALIEVLLLVTATIFVYGGVMAYLAMRRNDPAGVRSVLRGMAVPLGAVGAITLGLSVWGEMTWPFLASDGMAGYNIFFFDPLLLLAIVLVAFAATIYLSARLQYVGVLALVAGGVTAFYGYTGYTASPAFTKDPFDTLLLYAGFAAAGIFALPATIAVDYFLEASAAHRAPFTSVRRIASSRPQLRGTRAAVQPVLGHTPGAEAQAYDEIDTVPTYHIPSWVQIVVLLFPVFMALAAIAAFWYFGTTLPGHLGGGAGAAP
jgi:uncharacterized membrane protein